MIRIKIKSQQKIFTGFFIKITLKKKEYKFIFTCNHSIPQETIDSKIKISIYYGKKNEEKKTKIELDTNKRFIKTYEDLDVTIIEIKKEDNIPEYKYLFPDLNYKNGIKHYLNAEIYTAGYPNVKIHRGDKHYSAGIITKVDDNGYIFEHNCNTKDGSSGCPIINYNKFVIGIHYGYDKENKMNYGTFIGKIINELFLEEKNINPLMNDDSINKEDEKEGPKLKMPNKKEIDLGMHMLNKFLDNDYFISMVDKIAKNINDEQLMSNITKGLLNDFMPNPNDIDKFKDKNIDLKAISKYTYEKMGFF